MLQNFSHPFAPLCSGANNSSNLAGSPAPFRRKTHRQKNISKKLQKTAFLLAICLTPPVNPVTMAAVLCSLKLSAAVRTASLIAA
jgi:hypothetical protein